MADQNWGKFITFEGGEGSGKSTQIKRFIARLEKFLKRGIKVIQTREPGGCPAAEAIREMLVASDAFDLDPVSQTLLLYAGRQEHLKNLILPALASGDWVVSDRFSDSTRAYQAYAMGVDKAFVENLEAKIVGAHRPDLTFFLDIDPALGLERSFAQASGEHKYEAMGLQLHQKIYEGFLALIDQEPERFVRIDATGSIEEIEKAIWNVFLARFIGEKQ